MKLAEILLVEDNPADARLIQLAHERSKLRNTLRVINDGEAAIRYLAGEPPYENQSAPDLILLDLNLPRVSGFEVLEAIRGNERTRRIPVVVLTSSSAETDIVRSYELAANSYVTKPVDFGKWQEIVEGLEDYWFAIVKLPQR